MKRERIFTRLRVVKRRLLSILLVFVLLAAGTVLSVGAADAETKVDELTETVFKELMLKVSDSPGAYILFDLNTLQTPYPVKLFRCDSHGVAYANGKSYYYIDYSRSSTIDISKARAEAAEELRSCLTPELADRLAEDYHVEGGPDVELTRQESDGKWYKLFLIQPRLFVNRVDSIRVDGKNAEVKCNANVGVIDLERRADIIIKYPNDKGIKMDCTVDLVYTDDGWRISGGDIFDYIRNYAATSPETGDEKGERAVMFAAGAVVAAAVPAAILTLTRKRRKDKERDD